MNESFYESSSCGRSAFPSDASARGRFYLVGGGIASLAAAAFLIRDAAIDGHQITILEELDRYGGSLDGAGSPQDGYVIRGGRMLENNYVCTYDLFSTIPTLDGRTTVTKEIFDWNETMRTASKARLVFDGKPVDCPDYGLKKSHLLSLARLALEPESLLDDGRISDFFASDFFKTNFWFMWSTTFAFQPWHSAIEFRRYLVRFAHLTHGFNRLQGVMRTVFNQYDSMVLPIKKWLAGHGVEFRPNTRVDDLYVDETTGKKRVIGIVCESAGLRDVISLNENDAVFVTLGSMTASSSLGSTDQPAELRLRENAGAWKLWHRIAAGRPEFGKPSVFSDHVDESIWLSFTATLHDPSLFEFIQALTGNVPGEGGLVTFPESNWLLSIVLPHQPHFIGQPDDVQVLWGYGLTLERPGNFVNKPMAFCSGREILTEVLGHLQVGGKKRTILDSALCIPCLMPYITSQFLRRRTGDRPEVVPDGWENLAFMGQFCELREDAVFTVEYSIRSAQTAVYRQLGLDCSPPPVYCGGHDPRVLGRSVFGLLNRSQR